MGRCRTLGQLQEVPESAGRVLEGFGEVPERFWEVHGRWGPRRVRPQAGGSGRGPGEVLGGF